MKSTHFQHVYELFKLEYYYILPCVPVFHPFIDVNKCYVKKNFSGKYSIKYDAELFIMDVFASISTQQLAEQILQYMVDTELLFI